MNEWDGKRFIWQPPTTLKSIEESLRQEFLEELDDFAQISDPAVRDSMLRHIAFLDYLTKEGKL